MSDAVKLIFLGGQAEIGRNMFVLEHEDDLIVVDCGVGFPAIEHYGIDLVLPNFDYVKAARFEVARHFHHARA